MQPLSKNFFQLLTNLVKDPTSQPAFFASNYFMEERVSSRRQAGYETGRFENGVDLLGWFDQHTDYLNSRINIQCPETFTTFNSLAACNSLVACSLQKDQELFLIRIERLEKVLQGFSVDLDSLAQSADLLHNHTSISDSDLGREEASALLTTLANKLNTNFRADWPRFAGFEHELVDDIKAGDWGNRLRNRLGLLDYDPKDGPIPVALMRYTVKDILKFADKVGGVDCPVTIPTVLDHGLSDIFCPTPKQTPYGRIVDLRGLDGEPNLISEVLHLRIDYQPSHIYKVGAITASRPEVAVHELRDWHVECLNEETKRDDYGRYQPAAYEVKKS